MGQLPKSAEEPKLKSFRRWQVYSERVRRDPSVLAYYDFEQRKGNLSVLPNVAANGNHAIDGVIKNARWTSGRTPGKRALLFNGVDDYVQIRLPQKSDDLTLSTWVRLNAMTPEKGNYSSGLLMSDGWHTNGQIHWQIDNRSGQMAFVAFGCSKDTPSVLSPPVFTESHMWRWIHVACVYDHTTKRGRVYVDGSNVADVPYQMDVPFCVGSARIGSWSNEPRGFRGIIDEVIVFGRPLGAQEVQRLHDEGKP